MKELGGYGEDAMNNSVVPLNEAESNSSDMKGVERKLEEENYDGGESQSRKSTFFNILKEKKLFLRPEYE